MEDAKPCPIKRRGITVELGVAAKKEKKGRVGGQETREKREGCHFCDG